MAMEKSSPPRARFSRTRRTGKGATLNSTVASLPREAKIRRQSHQMIKITGLCIHVFCISTLFISTMASIVLWGTMDTQSLGNIRFTERTVQFSGLKMTRRRGAFGSKCNGYGTEDDPYFSLHDGVYCGLVKFKASEGLEFSEQGSLSGMELVVKVFENESQAEAYTERYWGIHTHKPLPSSMYTSVDAKMMIDTDDDEDEAAQLHILEWNPTLQSLSLLPEETVSTPDLQLLQRLVLWRSGRTFVRLSVSLSVPPGSPNEGYIASWASMKKLRQYAIDRIDRFVPQPSTLALRRAAMGVLSYIKAAEDTFLSLPSKILTSLKEGHTCLLDVFSKQTEYIPPPSEVLKSKVSENCSILDPDNMDCSSTDSAVPFHLPSSAVSDDKFVDGQLPASTTITRLLRTVGLMGPIEPSNVADSSSSAFGFIHLWLALGVFLGILSVSVAIDPMAAAPNYISSPVVT